MAITSGGKTYKNFAELEAAIMGKKPTTTKAPSKSPQVAPKKTREQMRAEERREEAESIRAMPTPKVKPQGRDMVQPTGYLSAVKNIGGMLGSAFGRIGGDTGRQASPKGAVSGQGQTGIGLPGGSQVVLGAGGLEIRTSKEQRDADLRREQQEAMRQEEERVANLRGTKLAQQRIEGQGDVRQGEEVMAYGRTPTTPAAEPKQSRAYTPPSVREALEQQMLLSADEDFLEEDMYGELGRAITETDAYTVAKELIQESIVQKKGESYQDAARRTLDENNEQLNKEYRKRVAQAKQDEEEATVADEDKSDNLKDKDATAGAEAAAAADGDLLLDGTTFTWDPEAKGQKVPFGFFEGDTEDYLKAGGATKLKNAILEAYANGSYFVIPGNEEKGFDPVVVRIDSRNELQQAIQETLKMNGLGPGEAIKAARQSLMNWEASINKIEGQHRASTYFNENFVDNTAGTPPVIAGEDPLPKIPEDWTDTVTEPDSPWWETFDEEAPGATKTASELAAEEGIPQSTVESDYWEGLADYTPTTPWSPPLEGLKQTAGSSDPSDPFSWNPFRGEERPGFDATNGINTYGMPENLNEAVHSTVWIAHQKAENLRGVMQVIDELGAPRWIDMTKKGNILGEFAEATTEQLSLLEHVERVQEGVDAIYDYDRQFRMTQGNARLDEYMMKEELAITTQHDVDMQSARTEADAMMLMQSHNQKMEQLKLELQDSREVMQLEQNFEQSKVEADYRFRGWLEENKMLQQQNTMMLDAAMKKYDIDEASRQAQAQESLKMTELNLQKTQMQFDLFKSLTSDPQMMFFMRQGGILSMFEDILGGQGNLAQITANYTNRISGHPIFKGIGEVPNIQEMAQKRPDEMQSAFFGAQALTGKTMEDVSAGLRGAAPWQMRTGQPTREIALS